jgi:hypothetical protein
VLAYRIAKVEVSHFEETAILEPTSIDSNTLTAKPLLSESASFRACQAQSLDLKKLKAARKPDDEEGASYLKQSRLRPVIIK